MKPGAILVVLLLVATLFPMPARAGHFSSITLNGDTQRADMSGRISLLVDPTASLSADQAARRADEFTPGHGPVLGGFTTAAYWLAFQIDNAADSSVERWFLEVGWPILDYVDLYLSTPDGHWQEMRMGDRVAFAERPVPHRNFVFPIDIPRGESRLALLRVKTSSSLLVRATLWNPTTFGTSSAGESMRLGLLYGVSGIIVLFVGYLWAQLRERLYFWFFAHAVALSALYISLNGHASQLFFPGMPLVADGALGFSFSLKTAFSSMFASHVLDARKNAPYLHRIYCFVAIISAALSFSVFIDKWAIAAPFVNAMTLAHAVVTFTIGISWGARGDYMARMVILSLLPVIGLAILLLLRNLGIIDIAAEIVDWGIQIGLIFNILILIYGLTRRGRLREQELRRLQDELLRASRIKEAHLAELVEEKTEEIVAGRRQVEAALETERRAARDQRTFLSMVAHEFRSPLQGIAAAAKVVGLYVPPNERDAHEELDSVQHGVNRLSRLVDAFLTDGWLETTALAPTLRPLDLADVLHDVCAAWRTERGVTRLTVIADTTAPVLGDKALLLAALSNLLDNALKYSPDGSSVELALTVGDDEATLSVSDRGMGVPHDDLSRIFDRYYRSANTMTVSGSGLGLHIVRKIAQVHRGDVTVSSEIGTGSTFRLHLPLGGAHG